MAAEQSNRQLSAEEIMRIELCGNYSDDSGISADAALSSFTRQSIGNFVIYKSPIYPVVHSPAHVRKGSVAATRDGTTSKHINILSLSVVVTTAQASLADGQTSPSHS